MGAHQKGQKQKQPNHPSSTATFVAAVDRYTAATGVWQPREPTGRPLTCTRKRVPEMFSVQCSPQCPLVSPVVSAVCPLTLGLLKIEERDIFCSKCGESKRQSENDFCSPISPSFSLSLSLTHFLFLALFSSLQLCNCVYLSAAAAVAEDEEVAVTATELGAHKKAVDSVESGSSLLALTRKRWSSRRRRRRRNRE